MILCLRWDLPTGVVDAGCEKVALSLSCPPRIHALFTHDFYLSQKMAELVYSCPVLLDAMASEMQRKGDAMMAKWAEIMTNMQVGRWADWWLQGRDHGLSATQYVAMWTSSCVLWAHPCLCMRTNAPGMGGAVHLDDETAAPGHNPYGRACQPLCLPLACMHRSPRPTSCARILRSRWALPSHESSCHRNSLASQTATRCAVEPVCALACVE
jgi:hypothetical protein